MKRSLETILAGVDQTQAKPAERDPKGFPILVFMPNPKMLKTVNTEELGTLEILQQTEASQSVAESKLLQERTVGDEAQFALTTEGGQCYNKHDRVTVDIKDEQGRECSREVRINGNKDGSYEISCSPKIQGKYKVTVKVSDSDSPFSVEVKLFQLRPVFSFGQKGSSDGMFIYPWGQPRSQGFFPGFGAEREKALASAGHVPTLHPEILGVIN